LLACLLCLLSGAAFGDFASWVQVLPTTAPLHACSAFLLRTFAVTP
jgi:hypothetical protein